MNYDEFIQIRTLVTEREHLKKGVSLIREMTVKSSSLQEFQARLVFAELKQPIPRSVGFNVPGEIRNPMEMIAELMKSQMEQEQQPEWRETGRIILDDMLLLHVAAALVQHWEKRIEEINMEIKALGLDP